MTKMLKYKLTDENMQTYGDTQWQVGVPQQVSGSGKLCGPNCLHVYDDPLLAVFLNPIHANFKNPRLFECECEGDFLEGNGLKTGVTNGSVTLTKEIPLPEVSLNQIVAFGILCSLETYSEPAYMRWAENWLNGTNRTAEAARAARAAEAAWAAEAAEAAEAAWAAWAAARAAWAAARAAGAAARAAEAAARAAWAANIDLIALAQKAMQYE